MADLAKKDNIDLTTPPVVDGSEMKAFSLRSVKDGVILFFLGEEDERGSLYDQTTRPLYVHDGLDISVLMLMLLGAVRIFYEAGAVPGFTKPEMKI